MPYNDHSPACSPADIHTPAYHAEFKARLRDELSSRHLPDELVDEMFYAVYNTHRKLSETERDPDTYTPEWLARQTKGCLRNVFNYLADGSGQTSEDERAAVLAVLDGYLGEFLHDGGIAQALADFGAAQAAQLRQQEIDRLGGVYGRGHFEDDGGDDADPLGDAQGPPPAVWGNGSDVLWAAGEALIIEAAIGVGKTTVAGSLVRALLFGGEVLGQPVQALAPGQRVLYLALDRPDQVKRSLARQFTPEQRAALPKRLVVWDKPLPAEAAENQNVLRDLAEFHDASVVVVDSLKDAAVGLSDERVAAAYDRARKRLLASGRELVELQHLTKGDEAYGSVFIPAGAGSIVRLSGKPGGLTGTVTHRKAPAHIVGPLKVVHDRDRGEILRATEQAPAPKAAAEAAVDSWPKDGYRDLTDWAIDQQGDEGVTAAEAAMFLYGSTERKYLDRAKCALNDETRLVYFASTGGRGVPSRWVYEDDENYG